MESIDRINNNIININNITESLDQILNASKLTNDELH